MFVILALTAAMILQSTPADWKDWGSQTLDQIRRELYLSKSHLYAEDDTKSQPAFNWPSGVMLSALNAAAEADDKYKPWLREYVEAMRTYWHKDGGYDVLPHSKQPDRYYDDNAWMALDLIDTAEILQDPKYLEWAEETVAFMLTGEDDKLGGGIYWRENEKKSKNTCANGPSALACLRLYVKTGKKQYLEDGRRIFLWTRTHLQDPKSTLYWDSISLTGKINRTNWSYNTALMMKAGRLLSRLDPEFKDQPDPTAAAKERWLQPDKGLIKDDMAFAHLFFESLLERGFPEAGTYLRGLHDSATDTNGHVGKRWNDVANGPRTHFRLIDQASAARAYFMGYLATTK